MYEMRDWTTVKTTPPSNNLPRTARSQRHRPASKQFPCCRRFNHSLLTSIVSWTTLLLASGKSAQLSSPTLPQPTATPPPQHRSPSRNIDPTIHRELKRQKTTTLRHFLANNTTRTVIIRHVILFGGNHLQICQIQYRLLQEQQWNRL